MDNRFTIGCLLILSGVVYLVKPDIFRQGIWKRTAVSQRIFSPEQYRAYMRVVGIVSICLGIFLVIWFR